MALPGFLYRNLASGLIPSAGSSTPAAGFPWTNLNNPQPRVRVRIASTTFTLIYDLGSALTVDTWFLGSTNLPTTSTARVRASNSDPAVLTSLDLDHGIISNITNPLYNGRVVMCFPVKIDRYWRLDIELGTNPIDVGISRLGYLFRPENATEYGVQEGVLDLSIRDLNEDTGAEFAISGPKKRVLQFTMAGTESEVRGLTTSFADMDRVVGVSGDVLFVEDSADDPIDRARDALYGSYREVGASLATRVANELWTRVFQMRERL